MLSWDVSELAIEPRRPEVLASDGEGRVIVLELPAGRAARESTRSTSAPGCWSIGGRGRDLRARTASGSLAAPACSRSSTPTSATRSPRPRTARLLLVLSPWPGVGPSERRDRTEECPRLVPAAYRDASSDPRSRSNPG